MIGQRIGNYRVLRLLGEGGMGVVYEAMRDDIGGRAAVKVLRAELSMNADIAGRFFNEARAANLIEHPGIVKIFDYGQLPSGAPYLAMELLSGESLHTRLVREKRFSEADTTRIGRQIAAALAAAHAKQVIHRDLKPENIFIVPDAEAPGGERAKLLDFGIAKLATDKTGAVRTGTNVVMGTPIYMSPEQCKGGKKVGERADVYALGVMLFEMLSGRLPFIAEEAGEYIGMHLFKEPPPLGTLVPAASPKLLKLVDSMLAKGPLQRPPMSIVAVILKELSNVSTMDAVSVRALAEDANAETQPLLSARALARTEAALLPPSSQPPSPAPSISELLAANSAAATPDSSVDPMGVTSPDPSQQIRSGEKTAEQPPISAGPDLRGVEDPTGPRSLLDEPTRHRQPGPKLRGPEPEAAEEVTARKNPQVLPIIKRAAMPSQREDLTVVPGPAVPIEKVDLDDLTPDSAKMVQPARSIGWRLRRLRYRVKKQVLGWLGIASADQRQMPPGSASPARRIALVAGTLIVAIGACVIVLLTLQEKTPPKTPVSAQSEAPKTPAPQPPIPSNKPDTPSPAAPSAPALPAELLAELRTAQDQAEAGKASAALKTARSAAKHHDHPAAWSAMGQYACAAKKLKLANDALEHLQENDVSAQQARAQLIAGCQQHGVTLSDNGRLQQMK